MRRGNLNGRDTKSDSCKPVCLEELYLCRAWGDLRAVLGVVELATITGVHSYTHGDLFEVEKDESALVPALVLRLRIPTA